MTASATGASRQGGPQGVREFRRGFLTRGGIAVAEDLYMDTTHHGEHRSRRTPGWFWPVLFGAFLLIAAFLLFEEHRAHMLGAIPYVLGIAGMLFCLLGHRHSGSSHHTNGGRS